MTREKGKIIFPAFGDYREREIEKVFDTVLLDVLSHFTVTDEGQYELNPRNEHLEHPALEHLHINAEPRIFTYREIHTLAKEYYNSLHDIE